jgi:hypothetical protein
MSHCSYEGCNTGTQQVWAMHVIRATHAPFPEARATNVGGTTQVADQKSKFHALKKVKQNEQVV